MIRPCGRVKGGGLPWVRRGRAARFQFEACLLWANDSNSAADTTGRDSDKSSNFSRGRNTAHVMTSIIAIFQDVINDV